jgi:DNA polymerase-3 subunit beta
MKFTASSADLLDALNTTSGAVPSKSTLPILECILFEQKEDRLVLSATDLEISIVQEVPGVQFAANGEAGREGIAVPARRLIDTLRALPDLPVTFSAGEGEDEGQVAVRLETDQGEYKMVGHDGEDYPDLPTLESEEHRIEIESALLGRAISKTSFAVSQDALRPAMMGIYFEIGPEEGRTVATDGHRLVRLTTDAMVSEEELSFIVPEKALSLAGRVASGQPEAEEGEDGDGGLCTVTVGEGHVGFNFGSAKVMARLIDETYPNYDAVIPDENEKRLTVGREALLAAAKRVGLYSSSTTNQIRLEIAGDRLEISAEDIERSSEAHEEVRCDFDGKGEQEMTIGFNANYLTEVLSNLSGVEDVVFKLSTPNRAGIVLPDEQREGEDMLMLIMPVMLNTYA